MAKSFEPHTIEVLEEWRNVGRPAEYELKLWVHEDEIPIDGQVIAVPGLGRCRVLGDASRLIRGALKPVHGAAVVRCDVELLEPLDESGRSL